LGGGVFTNDGIMSPGGANNIQTTDIVGDLTQNETGVYEVDIDFATGESDLINVSGTAYLAGAADTLDVDFNIVALNNGRQEQFVILTADEVVDNGIIGQGALFDQANGNVVLLVDLLVDEDKDEVTIDVLLDFTAPGNDLTPNQQNLAEHLNLIVDNGVGGMENVLLALINEAGNDIDVLLDAYDQMLPEIFLNGDTATLFSSEEFTNDLFGCGAHSKRAEYYGTANGGGRGSETVGCLWVRPKGRFLDFDGGDDNVGFEDTTVGVSAGIQFQFAPNFYANIAGSYERGDTSSDAGADSESDRFQGGISVQYKFGPWVFGTAFSGGIASYETERSVAFGSFAEVAESEHDVTFFTTQLRASYLAQYGSFYAKPAVDIRLTYLDRDDIVESGGNDINLKVKGDNDTFVSVSPSIELGSQYSAWSRTLRPFFKAGLTFFANNEHAANSEFLEQPEGIGTFTTTTEFSSVFADIETGVIVFDNSGSNLSIGYKGRLSEDTQQHGAYLKGALKF
ncbi:MAG: autotransporter domain-containing protein, partial [Pseudomonadota bacterium]